MFYKLNLRILLVISVLVVLIIHFNSVPSIGDDSKNGMNSKSNLKKQTLVIGKVSDNPKKHYKRLKPMADYVVSHMGDLGIQEAKVLMATDNRQMISYLKQGKVDWVTETAFSAVMYQDKTGAEILLRKWKKGVPEYHSIIFARKDSGINSLDDIRGKTIAFEDPGSTSAYYVPASMLIKNGLNLVQLASIREKPAGEMVGYVFSNEEVNTSTWVFRGLVDVGALSNLDWERSEHMIKVHKNKMKIIHKSTSFPRAVELVRKTLDPAIKQRLKKVLLNSHKDPNAQESLKAYQKTKKFDELDERSWTALNEVRQILQLVDTELN